MACENAGMKGRAGQRVDRGVPLPAPSAGVLGEAAHQRRCRGQRWPQDSYRTLPPAPGSP